MDVMDLKDAPIVLGSALANTATKPFSEDQEFIQVPGNESSAN
jgi:hypothetical protein